MDIEPSDWSFAANYGLALHQRAMQQHANVTRATYDYVKEQGLATYLAAEETLAQVCAPGCAHPAPGVREMCAYTHA
jgi:hypothetical protein